MSFASRSPLPTHLPTIALGLSKQPEFLLNTNASSCISTLQGSSDLVNAEKTLANHKEDVVKLTKKLKQTQGYRKYKLLLDLQQKRRKKITNLKSTASDIANRMKDLRPSEWQDFLHVSFGLCFRFMYVFLYIIMVFAFEC